LLAAVFKNKPTDFVLFFRFKRRADIRSFGPNLLASASRLHTHGIENQWKGAIPPRVKRLSLRAECEYAGSSASGFMGPIQNPKWFAESVKTISSATAYQRTSRLLARPAFLVLAVWQRF
jgi:hypothetical protein